MGTTSCSMSLHFPLVLRLWEESAPSLSAVTLPSQPRRVKSSLLPLITRPRSESVSFRESVSLPRTTRSSETSSSLESQWLLVVIPRSRSPSTLIQRYHECLCQGQVHRKAPEHPDPFQWWSQ